MAGNTEEEENNIVNDSDVSEILHLRQTDRLKYLQTNAVLRAIIDGVCDEQSELSYLDGTPEIIQCIWDDVLAWMGMCIKPGQDFGTDNDDPAYVELGQGLGFYRCSVNFPKHSGIRINMMPFVMGRTFKESKLPKYLKPYWDALFKDEFYLGLSFMGYGVSHLVTANQVGKIGYLTIDESYVKAGETQRRPGLHTDCPGKLMLCRESGSDDYICLGRVTDENKESISEIIDSKLGQGYTSLNTVNFAHPWGMTWSDEGTELVGGIYMASNVANSCQVWNCMLESDEEGREVIGNLGDVEHLRNMLPGKPEIMKANKVYWITDRTPHESLPLKEDTYRQYFRLVTSEVSLWFEEHSTKNLCGVVPDPTVTKIVKGSKFENNLALLDLNMPNVTKIVKVKKKGKQCSKCVVA